MRCLTRRVRKEERGGICERVWLGDLTQRELRSPPRWAGAEARAQTTGRRNSVQTLGQGAGEDPVGIWERSREDLEIEQS